MIDYSKTRRKFINEKFRKTPRTYKSMEQLNQLALRDRNLRARMFNETPKQKAIGEAKNEFFENFKGIPKQDVGSKFMIKNYKKTKGQFVSQNWQKFLK